MRFLAQILTLLLLFISVSARAVEIQGDEFFKKHVLAGLEVLRTTPTGQKIAREIDEASWLQIERKKYDFKAEAVGTISMDSQTGIVKLLINLENPRQTALVLAHEFSHVKDQMPLTSKVKAIQSTLSDSQIDQLINYFSVSDCLEEKKEICIREHGERAVEFALVRQFTTEYKAFMTELTLMRENPALIWKDRQSNEGIDENFIKNHVYEVYIKGHYPMTIDSEKLAKLSREALEYGSLLDIANKFLPEVFGRN